MLKNKNLGRYSSKPLLEMSAHIAGICDANDLIYSAEHGRTKADKPYLKYEIRLEGNQAVLFGTTITSHHDEYTKEILKAVRGVTVSPASPPAMRHWMGETIYYWKRMTVVERTEEPYTNAAISVASFSAWVGFSKSNKEICRVKDGSSNPGYETIARVDIVDLGPLGKVYAVVPHWKEEVDTSYIMTMGETILFKEVMEEKKRKEEQEKIALQLAHSNSRLEQACSSMATAPSMPSLATSELSPVSFVKTIQNKVPLNDLKSVVAGTDSQDAVFNEESVSSTLDVNVEKMQTLLPATDLPLKADERYFDGYQKELLGELKNCPLPHDVKVALIALHGTYTNVEGMAFDLIDGQTNIDDDAIKNYIPKVLSDSEFEVLSDPERARYNARIDYLVQIASSKEIREDGHVASGLICDFLTKVAMSDMFLGGYLLFLSRTQFQYLEEVDSLISYTAGIYNYPQELSEYLFASRVLKGETNTHFIAPSKVDDVAKVLRLPLENMWALLTTTGWTIGDPIDVDPKYTSMLYGKLNIEQRFY